MTGRVNTAANDRASYPVADWVQAQLADAPPLTDRRARTIGSLLFGQPPYGDVLPQGHSTAPGAYGQDGDLQKAV